MTEESSIPNVPEKSTFKKLMPGCLAAIGLFIGCIVIAGSLAFYFTKDLVEPRDAFLTGLQNEEYEAVFDTLHPTLQEEIGSATEFANAIQGWGIDPADWNTRGRSIENGNGSINGNVTFSDGERMTYTLEMRKTKDVWKIISFLFHPQE